MSETDLQYIYFVFYSFEDGEKSGRCEVGFYRMIESIDDIAQIENLLEKSQGHKRPFVKNFIFLRSQNKKAQRND